jgi:hypothetical protein
VAVRGVAEGETLEEAKPSGEKICGKEEAGSRRGRQHNSTTALPMHT